MMVGEETLRGKYDEYEWFLDKKYKRLKNDLEETEPLNIVSRYESIWNYEYNHGSVALCLGDYETARESFAEGAAFKTVYLYVVLRAHRRGNKVGGAWQAYLGKAEKALQTAILGGDEDIARRAIRRIQSHTKEDTEQMADFSYWHHRVHAFAALVDGDTDSARHHVDRAREYLDAVEFQGEPYLSLYQALAQKKESNIEDAAETLAEIHANNFDPNAEPGQQLLSRHAVSGLALARRRGLDVALTHDAVPQAVSQHDWEYRDHEFSELAEKALAAVEADREESGVL